MRLAAFCLVMSLCCACRAALRCQKAAIVITADPAGRPKPAGRVAVGCDGRPVVVIDADEVLR